MSFSDKSKYDVDRDDDEEDLSCDMMFTSFTLIFYDYVYPEHTTMDRNTFYSFPV